MDGVPEGHVVHGEQSGEGVDGTAVLQVSNHGDR